MKACRCLLAQRGLLWCADEHADETVFVKVHPAGVPPSPRGAGAGRGGAPAPAREAGACDHGMAAAY